MFSARVTAYQGNTMLNMCDADLLGRIISQGDISMDISRGYYGERMIDEDEAGRLLRGSSIINMVGRETVALSIRLGIGSEGGVKVISGVPFLIVFKM